MCTEMGIWMFGGQAIFEVPRFVVAENSSVLGRCTVLIAK
jgi:hypothetical protein